jgi:hypothetical protein
MAKHMSDSNTPTHEQITRRAYEIFIERGQPENRDLEHWLEAEKQLRATGQTKNAKPVSATSSANTTPSPMRATQPVAASNGRSAGNGKTASPRAAARK